MNGKKRYVKGEKITSLSELLSQKVVYFGEDGGEGLIKKRYITSQHPNLLRKYIDKGWFKKAEEETK